MAIIGGIPHFQTSPNGPMIFIFWESLGPKIRKIRADVFQTWHVLRYWPVERSGFSMAKQICRVKQTNLGAVPGDKSLICSIHMYLYIYIYILYIYIYIYTANAWVLPGPATTTGDASSSSSSSSSSIKPLLEILNACRSFTGVGELNPYWRSSMNVEV